jgi:UDP-glucose 4-epimerase
MKNTATHHPRRYLVTGGFGYAGSWISEHLASQGHQVFVLSRHAGASGAAWPCTPINADVASLSPEALASLLPESLDGLVHAASLNEEFLPDYPRQALLVNGLGTRNLIAALLLKQEQPGQSLPLLIYCSTIHVYGTISGEISEATPPQPRNDYALTHYLAEEYCRLFMRTRNIPCIIARLSNGYGAPKLPGSDKWYLLLNDLCKTAVHDRQIVLRSHPDTPRDFIWLGDTAGSIHALLERPDLAGSLFNISSGQSTSIGEVARRVAAVVEKRLGRSVPLRFENASAAPPADLRISNAAFTAATGRKFEDHMEKEIANLLTSLGV